MANWLSRATSLFQQPTPPPEPFEVECDCGAKVFGQRMKTYQRPSCTVCERPVFVLPANIYPQSKSKSTGNKRSAANPAAAKATPPSTNTAFDLGPPPASTNRDERKPPVVKGAAYNPVAVREPSFQTPSKPIVTPLRLMIVVVAAVGTVLVGGLWYRYRLERAAATISPAAEAGKAALFANDFKTAAREFARARAAVDLLGRTDETANDIRRSSHEATAIDKLATSSLSEILLETLKANERDATGTLKMSGLYKGAWVIFDANLIPSFEGKDRFIVDAPMLFAEGNVNIEIETSMFQDLTRPNEEGEAPRIIFAAQLEQLNESKNEMSGAVLILNGKTAFLWANYDNFVAAGYRPIDPESEQQTRAILERQREMGKR
jgi:hypothetical protein